MKAAMDELFDDISMVQPSGYYAYYAVHSLKDGILDEVVIELAI